MHPYTHTHYDLYLSSKTLCTFFLFHSVELSISSTMWEHLFSVFNPRGFLPFSHIMIIIIITCLWVSVVSIVPLTSRPPIILVRKAERWLKETRKASKVWWDQRRRRAQMLMCQSDSPAKSTYQASVFARFFRYFSYGLCHTTSWLSLLIMYCIFRCGSCIPNQTGRTKDHTVRRRNPRDLPRRKFRDILDSGKMLRRYWSHRHHSCAKHLRTHFSIDTQVSWQVSCTTANADLFHS